MESVQNILSKLNLLLKRMYENVVAYIRAHPRGSAITAGSVVMIILGFWLPVDPPHVSLSGEPIFETGPRWLTNSLLTTLVVDIIIILMALGATARMKLVPHGWQNFIEAVLEYLYGLCESVSGQDARKYFPWVVTIFLLVIISNWSGLIPGVGSIGFYHGVGAEGASEHAQVLDRQLAMSGGSLILVDSIMAPAAAEEEHAKFVPLFRAPSADLNMTFALAISTMVMVQIYGIRALGGSYFRKFFNASGDGWFQKGVNAFVGILELLSEFSRIIAFGFRLFGNIFAGEIVLATMAFLIAFLLPIPFYALEIFVGFVQALVFMMLALAFFSLATISHSHEHEH